MRAGLAVPVGGDADGETGGDADVEQCSRIVPGAGLPCVRSFLQAPAPPAYAPSPEPTAENAMAATAPIRPISAAVSGLIDIPFSG